MRCSKNVAVASDPRYPFTSIESGGIHDVLAGAALAYSFLVTFVLSCARRNFHANRRGAPMLQLVGWALMAGSFAMAALLIALVVMRAALG